MRSLATLIPRPSTSTLETLNIPLNLRITLLTLVTIRVYSQYFLTNLWDSAQTGFSAILSFGNTVIFTT
ncbi:unnamed protein product [Strongylus vulgaris]|uniref:Uncharacterized protein n=1 Tax=Strongylus vulgaris TaxID=40348 RepID=A0A3P7JUJ3_STRVU|nr:unnamed protein product [Strongylus vulgaris]